jgi:hypothetical protein
MGFDLAKDWKDRDGQVCGRQGQNNSTHQTPPISRRIADRGGTLSAAAKKASRR